MPTTVIESDWRETPMICPNGCGPMYSDGMSPPVCGNDNCLHQATIFDILQWLITEHGESELLKVVYASRSLLTQFDTYGRIVSLQTFKPESDDANRIIKELRTALDELDKMQMKAWHKRTGSESTKTPNPPSNT